MKFILPSAFFSLAYLSQASAAVAAQCSTSADLVNDAPTDFEGEPITIVSQDEATVTFTVSQTWSDDLLCLIATHHTDDTGVVCPDVPNAAPGEVAEYTAVCVGGFATVDLYVYDPTFTNPSPPTINSICPQVDTGSTYLYQYSIPCGEPTCPTPDTYTCDDLKSTTFDFENSAEADEWLFGAQGTTSGNSYLKLDADTLEVSKSFEIPSGTTKLNFKFDVLAISQYAGDQKIYARVGDYYLNMTSAIGLGMASSKTEYFGEILTRVEKLGFTNNLRVDITVPAELYEEGHISLGVRSFGSSSTAVAGVDNVAVTLECSDDGFTGGNQQGGGGGDPHFQRWGREHSSFHGECDLVMVSSEQFHNNAGLDLHVRTTIQDYFSYIESAALRVGDSVLEFHQRHFFLNGAKYTAEDLPLTFGGDFKYTVSEAPLEAGKNPKFYQYFKVDLHENSDIVFKFYKKFLTISVSGHPADFSDSVGLLGEYSTGEMLSRSGAVMTDFEQYGFEWQVTPEDAKLFLDARAPQLPYEQCRMPTAARPARRKLRGADNALFEAAKTACAHVTGNDYDLCTDDVMSTGDVGLASLW